MKWMGDEIGLGDIFYTYGKGLAILSIPFKTQQ